MKSHALDYQIIGDDIQIVEVELDSGETVIAEAGAMNYFDEGVVYEARMGDGSAPEGTLMDKMLGAGKRVLMGESLFLTHFTNKSSEKKRVAFSAPYPGKILAIDLAKVGGELICQKDAFLCAVLGTEICICFNKRFGVGLFGGEGFILQRLRGDGLVFVHAGGTVVEKQLKGEKLYIDTGCIVGFVPSVEYSIQQVRDLKSAFFGGEGLFLATLQGQGTVYLQSMPFSRLADRIIAHAPSRGGRSREEGSALRGLGRFLDGDNS